MRTDAKETSVEVQILPNRKLAVEGVRLGNDAEELLGHGGVLDDVHASDGGSTRRRNDSGGEHARRRRLARSVGTK